MGLALARASDEPFFVLEGMMAQPEAKLVIDRNPPSPDKPPTGRFAAANAAAKANAEDIKARRGKIHEQAKIDALGGGSDVGAKDGVAVPERENIETIDVPLRDGRVVTYGPPTGISLSERIARMFAPRAAAEGGPDPGVTEYRLTRLLMGVRSIDGKPVVINNLIDRSLIANRLGDEAIDLLAYFDGLYWPPLRQAELPLIQKKYKT